MRRPLLVSLGLLILVGGALAAPWVGPGGGDLRTGYAGDQLLPPLELKWRFVTGDQTWTAASPAVYGELLVFAVGKTVYGVDPQTGEKKWEHTTTDVVNSDITIGDELVLVGDHSGVLYGIDRSNGNRVFQYRTVEEETRTTTTTPGAGGMGGMGGAGGMGGLMGGTGQQARAVESGFALVGDLIYFGDDQGIIHAVKATKEPVAGVGLWKFNAGQAIKVAPTYYRGSLFVATLTEIVALQRVEAQGEQMWKAELGGGGRYILGSPVVVDDRVLVGVGDQVVALSSTTGQVIWRAPAQGSVVGSPAVANGKVCFGCTGGLIYCVNLANGESIWRANVNGLLPVSPEYSEYRQAIHTSVVIGGNTVYARTRTGTLVAVDVDSGQVVWRYDIGDLKRPQTTTGVGGMGGAGSGMGGGPMAGGGGALGGPAGGMGGMAGGMQSYLGTTTNTLALDLSSGLAASDDTLFVLGGEGELYALASGAVDSGPPIVKRAEVYIPRTDGTMLQTGYPIAVYDANGYPDRVVSPMQMVHPSGALPSAGPIAIQAKVSDLGSGVVPESVSVSVTGPNGDVASAFIYLDSRHTLQVFIPDRPGRTNRALDDGAYVVHITATDYAGRSAVSEIRFTVDGTVPSPATQQGMGGGMMGPGSGGMGMR